MKRSFVFGVIAVAHFVVIGGFLFMQGCQSARTPRVDPPPAPVLPVDEAEEAVERTTPGPRVAPPVEPARPEPSREIQTYTVRSGDILSRIANRYGVSVRELAEINSITDPDSIYAGQTLILPGYARRDVEEPAAREAAPEPSAPRRSAEPGEVYEVVSGDVLSRIAVRHDTTVQEIMELNNLDSTKIIVGQKLRMPAGDGEPAREPESRPERTPTSPVETPEEPADEADEQDEDDLLSELLAPEAESTPQVRDAGERERIQPRSRSTLYSTADYYVYNVSEGEDLMSIAKRFAVDPHELRRINELSRDDRVAPGQQIKIPMSDL